MKTVVFESHLVPEPSDREVIFKINFDKPSVVHCLDLSWDSEDTALGLLTIDDKKSFSSFLFPDVVSQTSVRYFLGEKLLPAGTTTFRVRLKSRGTSKSLNIEGLVDITWHPERSYANSKYYGHLTDYTLKAAQFWHRKKIGYGVTTFFREIDPDIHISNMDAAAQFILRRCAQFSALDLRTNEDVDYSGVKIFNHIEGDCDYELSSLQNFKVARGHLRIPFEYAKNHHLISAGQSFHLKVIVPEGHPLVGEQLEACFKINILERAGD